MRNVEDSGTRIPGIKPIFCASEKKLIMAYHPMFASGTCRSWLRSNIVKLSDSEKRTFEVSTFDGQTVRLRGLIGERHVEEQTQRFYETLKTYPNQLSLQG